MRADWSIVVGLVSRFAQLVILRCAVVLLAGCAVSSEPLEVITRVPEHVLTASEVRARMRRTGSELGVGTEGLLVQGQCVSVCAERSRAITPGAEHARAAEACVARFGDPGDRPIPVLLSDDAGTELEAGRRYVLRGSVRADERVRERWVFVGSVMAEVR